MLYLEVADKRFESEVAVALISLVSVLRTPCTSFPFILLLFIFVLFSLTLIFFNFTME